jgi:multidrug transporter EmrE-like cation transporter
MWLALPTQTLRRVQQTATFGGDFRLLRVEGSQLNLHLKEVDLSFAYAVWFGVGMAPIATVGILWFSEPLTALKIVSLELKVMGAVGLTRASKRINRGQLSLVKFMWSGW